MTQEKRKPISQPFFGLTCLDIALLGLLILVLFLGLITARWRVLFNREIAVALSSTPTQDFTSGPTVTLSPVGITEKATTEQPTSEPPEESTGQPTDIPITSTMTPTVTPTITAMPTTTLTADTPTPRVSALWLDNKAVAVEAGLIYTLTVTNKGPTSPVTATIVNMFSPAAEVVAVSGAGCGLLSGGVITCTVGTVSTDTPYNLILTTTVNTNHSGTITNTATITGTNSAININPNNSAVVVATVGPPPPHLSRYAKVVYVQSNGHTHYLGIVTSTGEVQNYELHFRAAAPAWSPDGTRIAFFGEQGISELGGIYGGGNGVWIIDDRGENPKQLVQLDHVKNIAWSPDGKNLAFEVDPPSIPSEIRIVDSIDGRELNRFPGEQPAWSPDSRKLVIRACLPDCGLWQVKLDGSGKQHIILDSTASYPAWSPTDQYLAFSSERAGKGNWEIYRLRLADGNVLRLTKRLGTDTTPVFSREGQEIYLRTDAFGGWRITVMTLDGRHERLVKEGVGPSEDWGLARPAVH